MVTFEDMKENDDPVVITQSEFMRRMKDMAAMGGGAMNFYGELPDNYNLVINPNHKLVEKIIEQKDKKVGAKIEKLLEDLKPFEQEKETLEKNKKDKKEEEISQADKDKLAETEKQIEKLQSEKKDVLTKFGQENKYVKQLIDLALLANNMLKGEELTRFVKRSIELIK